MTWAEVPQAVRDCVAAHLGLLTDVEDVAAGASADFTVVVTLRGGTRAFVKGVGGVSHRMRWLRNEVVGNAAAGSLAPTVLFSADLDDEGRVPWLVVGTEFVDGDPVSFAPGSPDLDVLASTIERIAALAAPADFWPMTRRWAPTDWWQRCAEHSPEAVTGWDVALATELCGPVPQLVDGDRLVHTDLHPGQILRTRDGTVRVIDWSYPCAGAPWVDTGLTVLRLIIAGHDPANAEAWARRLTTFHDVDATALDAFAVYVAGLWTHLAHTRPLPGSSGWARTAREWAAWRRGRHAAVLIP